MGQRIAHSSMIEINLILREHLPGRNKMMQLANIVNDDEGTVLNLLHGTRLEILSPSNENAYWVMKGALPPGVSVPLHSHSDAESFYGLVGEGEVLVQTPVGLEWKNLRPGDFIHVPGGRKHAWRNRSSEPISILVTCTARLGRALREMAQVPASPDAIQRLAEISERYGYWLGSPEENASVGIVLV
jgi:quercetin dioxygenase-like cupin family protein